MTTLSPLKTRILAHFYPAFGLILLFLLLSLGMGWRWLAPALASAPAGVDVTDRVAVSFSGLRLNRATGTFDTVATLTNQSAGPVRAPLSLMITGITPPSVTLANASGTTPENLPYLTVPVANDTLDAGATVTVVLRFNNPDRVSFTFTHQVFGVLANTNTPPVANAGQDQTAPLNSPVTLDGSGSSDADGDQLTFHWSLVAPAGSGATLSDSNAVKPTFQVDLAGQYVATLIVNDGKADSAPAMVTISTLNSAPTANAGLNRTVPLGSLVQLDGSKSSDPDGDPLSFLWSLTPPSGSAAVLDNPLLEKPSFVADRPGAYEGKLTVSDGKASSAPATVTISTQNSKPVANPGEPQTVVVNLPVTLDGSNSNDADGNPLTYRWSFTSTPDGSTASLQNDKTISTSFTPDKTGLYVVQLIVNDGTVDSDPVTVTITVQPPLNRNPQITSTPVTQATVGQSYSYTVTATDPDGDTLAYALSNAPEGMTIAAGNGLITWTPTSTGDVEVTIQVTDGKGGRATQSYSLHVSEPEPPPPPPPPGPIPPDPATVAPPVDPTVTTTMADATSFLYSGSNPIQTGVQAGTIELKRAAVVRGRVLDQQNNPLSGVTLTIKDHPEFGQTLSRADGMFDLAVNGGGYLTVNYQRAGFLPVQRQLNVPWQDFALVKDVIMMQVDTKVTPIDLTNTTQAFQVAQGSAVTDQDGARQATILFPQGTQAQMVMPDGSTQPLTNLQVRATEYTVGPNGPKAMPAELPPTSGYTYAVELSVDEALAAGATDVKFDRPVPFYVQNFLNFPVGMIVPAGYYDRQKGAWIPFDNGKVIKILSIEGGIASLDTDGDSAADTAAQLGALGITDAERQQLAARYSAGQTLWRVPIKHFTPWDYNWPYGPPPGATEPQGPEPTNDADDRTDDPDCSGGSIIECENQTLGEVIPIAGTPFTLNYRSDRISGRKNGLRIPLTGATVPSGVKQVVTAISSMGQQWTYTFNAQPNQTYVFPLRTSNVYGQDLSGGQPVKVSVGYTYQAVYYQPAAFAQAFSLAPGIPTANQARQEITLWRESTLTAEVGNGPTQSFAGWSLDIQQAYDPQGKVLFGGDGQRISILSKALSAVISTVAGNRSPGYSGDGGPATQASLATPFGIAVGADGSLYIAEFGNNRIRRVGPDGIITTVAGNGSKGYSGDGGPATQAELWYPSGVAVGADGSLYIADERNNCIRRVGPDGIITTVAGNGSLGYSSDGGPATQAELWYPSGVAVGADDSLYIVDYGSNRIRRVGLDGIITTVAGNGNRGYSGDSGPATQVSLLDPNSVAVGADGSLYIADSSYRIRRVRPDGIITTVAGNGNRGYSGDGGPATQARLYGPSDVAVGADGSLYIADYSRIRRVRPDGIITTVAGNGSWDYSGDGGPATQASFKSPSGVAVGTDDSLYIADSYNHRIRRTGPLLPGLSGNEIVLTAEDGSELYVFNGNRHTRTLNATTGATLYQFGYDSGGRLSTVTDAFGNVTTIERDGSGNPTAIVAPFGQRTTLTVDGNGWLASVTNPAGESYQMQYTADGLLTQFQKPLGTASTFAYDPDLGRLIKDIDANQGSQNLTFTKLDNGFQVKRTTGLGRSTLYKLENLSTGETRRTVIAPDQTQTVTVEGTDGSQRITRPDGTVIESLQGPDPRFGMLSPITESLKITDGSLVSTMTTDRTVALADASNPLSLTQQTDKVTVNGRTTTSIYTTADKTLKTTSPAGRQTTAWLDNVGRLVQAQVPSLLAVKALYDAQGRLQSVTQGDGADARTMTYHYNDQGYLDQVTDPLGRRVSYLYDPAGRVIQETLPDNSKSVYQYDANGNLTGLTPPGRPQHQFSYTPVDLMATYDPPMLASEAASTEYSYNLDKQLTKVVRPDNQTIEFFYGADGKLTGQSIPGGNFAYSYDPATGRLTALQAPDGGQLSFQYSGSLLSTQSWSGAIQGQVGFGYDNDFRVTSVTVNGANPVTYQYDADSLLTHAGDLTLSRSAQNGLLTGTTLGSVSDSRSYDGFGDVTDYTAQYSGNTLLSTQYTYDPLGRITRKVETVQGKTDTYDYSYDLAGRLEKVKQNGVTISAYSYDANGNRLSYTAGGSTVNGSYDAQDRLLTYGGNAYTYTANGELLSKSSGGAVTTYQYDVLGNLKHVELPDGRKLDYLVDGRNRRIGKKIDGVLKQGFLYQGQLKPIAELDGNGSVVSRFVYATHVNVPDYMIRGGNTYRIITDHLGSPRLVVNIANGAVAQRLDYDEFGNVLTDTNPGFQPFGFAGGLYDRDTGLVRFGARDYEAETGRWTAKDPMLFGGVHSSLYSYVSGDTINLIDPTGLIVVAGDPAGQQLLHGLAATLAGNELLEYLEWSLIKYTVYGSRPIPNDPAGQFGLSDEEAQECGRNGPTDQIVRVSPTNLMNQEEKIVALGHELGHAALYDYYFSQRPLPDFLDPSWNIPGSPGGMEESAHIAWSFDVGKLFH